MLYPFINICLTVFIFLMYIFIFSTKLEFLKTSSNIMCVFTPKFSGSARITDANNFWLMFWSFNKAPQRSFHYRCIYQLHHYVVIFLFCFLMVTSWKLSIFHKVYVHSLTMRTFITYTRHRISIIFIQSTKTVLSK